MANYRKKPVVVEAVQLRAGEEPCEIAPDVMSGAIEFKEDGTALIATLEGVMIARPGDWVIRGAKGALYTCKPDVFALTYEEA